jgi:1-deoxyxylulose-5-phosphate synthase
MELKMLGKTDLTVSRLSLGTMTFGGPLSEKDSVHAVDRSLELGINFFDTANIYHDGRAEQALGRALRGRRHKVVLATKVCGRMGPDGDDAGLSRAAIRKALEGSLERLATDYVDLYCLHHPDGDTRIQETLAAMEELVQEGKIRYPAVSNYASWQILQMLWHCENHGYAPITTSQQMYNLLARGIEQEYVAFCKEYGIALIVYNPLAGGLLTGKHLHNKMPLPGTRFDGNQVYLDRYWHEPYLEAVERVADVARRAGLSMTELSLRWLLSRTIVDSVILGVTSMDQLDSNVKASQGPPLSQEVLDECQAVWVRLRGVTPQYNR